MKCSFCSILYSFCGFSLLGHDNVKGLQLIICLSIGIEVILVIAAFLVITVANRRFYTRHIRENAHHVGSVITEHTIANDMYKPPESSTRYCGESKPTDSGAC